MDVEYVIYETPHPPDTGQPCEDEPDTACPDTENPDMDNPCLENRPQLNKEKRNPEEQNTDSLSTEGSNPIQSSPQSPAGANRTGRDWMRERESYRELILENIEYAYLCRDDRLDRDMLNELWSSWWIPSVPAGRRSALPETTIRRRWSNPGS